ncbi:MAG: hypothetical protein CMP28_02865 [Roseibacillus sp.]|nr:hypothetical protein [Roseibacillus sp.]
MNRRLLLFLPPFAVLSGVLCALLAGCMTEEKDDLPPEHERTGAGAAYAHTRKILSFGPRPTASSGLSNTRKYITSQLEDLGWQVTPQSFTRQVNTFIDDHRRGVRVPFRREMRFTNLIARFGDAAENDIEGLLCAHIDSKLYLDRTFLGADDAASAVGVILELARQLGNHPEMASRLELVFFDGEEAFGQNISPNDGLYGSKHYARIWRTAPRKPRFGIVLDMIGHRNLQIRYPSDTPAFLEEILLEAARSIGAGKRYTRGLNPIMDDHVPLNNAGVPTIDVIGDFSKFSWWHTSGDNLRLISRDSLAITLQVTWEMLNSLLN